MLEGKKIAVVVPCYNESRLIKKVIDSMPSMVDLIIVVDDVSKDNTVEVVEQTILESDKEIKLICHSKNQGVGGAIASGYIFARDMSFDVTVVMAGDAQMDPNDLPSVVDPVVKGLVDYSKGNRLFSGDAWNMIPRVRYIGNALLSLLTKIASGYWHVADSQSGYTAISLKALNTIKIEDMYKRYGQPNDLLVRLNIYNFKVQDVPIKPVYGIGEESGVKPIRLIPKLSWLLFRLFLFRMKEKYLIRDFHPLLFFYVFGSISFVPGLLFGLYLTFARLCGNEVAGTSAMFSIFLCLIGMQFLLFAMWFDMENNRDLK